MKKVFVLYLLTLSLVVSAKDWVKICGEERYVVPENVSLRDAKNEALMRAKANALAEHFGTIIHQGTTSVIKENNVGLNEYFIQTTGQELRGEWIEDIGQPIYRILFENEMQIVEVSICGKARERKLAEIDLVAKLLRNDTDNRSETEKFQSGDAFYLYFRTPIKGYLSVYLIDENQQATEIGEKVLFLCYNRKLCDFLREKYMCENVHYYTIDALACYLCNTSTADYGQLENTLMEMYYSGVFPYKHIIIDEGQDFGQNRIEESSVIQTLESIVLSDEIKGTFYLFYDKNQLVQGRQIPQYIADSDCKLTLYKNCRNTENIAITSMRPLGKDKKPKMFQGCVKGVSPDIHIASSEADSLEYLNKVLKKLTDEKYEDIVILTCTTEDQSWLSANCVNGSYPFNNRQIKFTSCRKFKGLEADAIVLIDVMRSTFDVGGNNLVFYVGASRARFRLSIIVNMSDDECRFVSEILGNTLQGKPPKKMLAASLNALLQ